MTDNAFSADWLALREAADRAARNAALVRDLANHFEPRDALSVLDLGAGSGANLRTLAPKLKARQRWRLVDNDRGLLARATAPPRPDADIETLCCDLARDPDRLDVAAADLVTASALMDLVSADWFDGLAKRCRKAGTALFLTLTYDGTIGFAAEDADDDWVRRLVNRHQQTDKGFGPALGPEAPAYMETALRARGYRVRSGRSDWRLGPDDAALQEALLAGYADAADALAPREGPRLQAWLDRRRAKIALRGSRLTVGHRDLLALP